MDELGNWVYILLMVVVGVSSLISSMNKKKREQQTHVPAPEIPEEWFPVPPVPPASMKKTRKSPPPVSGNRGQQPFGSQLSSSVTESRLQSDTSGSSEAGNALTDELGLTDADAFRKAIIYSEILNRKYS